MNDDELARLAAQWFQEGKPAVEQARSLAAQGIACAPVSLDGRYAENPTTNSAAYGAWGAVLPNGRGLLLSNAATDLRMHLRRKQLVAGGAKRLTPVELHSFSDRTPATSSVAGNPAQTVPPAAPAALSAPAAPALPTFSGATPSDDPHDLDEIDAEYQRELAADPVALPVAVPVAPKTSTEPVATTADDVPAAPDTSPVELFNVSTVAKRAHLSRQAVLRRLNGTKTRYRVGTAPLLTHEELEQFVALHGNGHHNGKGAKQ